MKVQIELIGHFSYEIDVENLNVDTIQKSIDNIKNKITMENLDYWEEI